LKTVALKTVALKTVVSKTVASNLLDGSLWTSLFRTAAPRRAGRTRSESRLNPFCKGSEITNALHFIIGEFDFEMVFEPRQHLQGLQGINAQFFEEIIIGRQLLARGLEMSRREVEDFVNGLILGSHEIYSNIGYIKHKLAESLECGCLEPLW